MDSSLFSNNRDTCSFSSYVCGFTSVTRDATPGDELFELESEFDEEQLREIRSEILYIPGVSMKVLLPNTKLYHSTSSHQSWWNHSMPQSQSAGGIFFSTVPQLSILGGAAPLGVTLEYRVIDNNLGLLYLPNRSLLFSVLVSLSQDTELVEQEKSGHYLTGDEIIPLLNQLGFNGYYSCEECEIYLTNDTINKIIDPTPVTYEDRRINSTYTIRFR